MENIFDNKKNQKRKTFAVMYAPRGVEMVHHLGLTGPMTRDNTI